MTFNKDKSQVIIFCKGYQKSTQKWLCGEKLLREVKKFSYLGVTFQSNGNFTSHIKPYMAWWGKAERQRVLEHHRK